MLLTRLPPQIAPFCRYVNVLSNALQLERAQTLYCVTKSIVPHCHVRYERETGTI